MRLIFVFLSLLCLILWACNREAAPDFNTAVRPILNKHCLPCHGGVKQSGGISFLFREEALRPGRSGMDCIVPGRPDKSELMARINSDHPVKRMPLDAPPLADSEIDILRRWIKAGAYWDNPWSYAPVVYAQPPSISDPPLGWEHSPIDAFLLEKIRENGLVPNEEQDAHRLIRRLSFDLIGLPPKPEWVATYAADPSPATYAALVDTLLNSPHFGENWAAPWLDLARFADTKGYERDGHRQIWRYRDWVIDAFNSDMPYDSFCIKQLAGDLLPKPQHDDYIATAFHRNTMSNDEGGTDNNAFRIEAVMDRVSTTWTAFMGTTMSCVQCHAHPYDPLRHKDYYTSLAVFNNDLDEDTHHDSPVLHVFPQPDSARLLALADFIQQLPVPKTSKLQGEALTRELLSIGGLQHHPHFFDSLDNAAHWDSKWIRFRPNGRARLPKVALPAEGGWLLTHTALNPKGGTLDIHLGDAQGPIWFSIQGNSQHNWQHQLLYLPPLPAAYQGSDQVDLWFSYQEKDLQKGDFAYTWFVFLPHPFPEAPLAAEQAWADQVLALYNSPTKESVPILSQASGGFRRTTQIFERGSWLTLGDTVQPAVPVTLALPDQQPIDDRLGFARWMTHPDHPLTPRVVVNRFWAALFGTGLVETSEDFGSQGTPPSHPTLLDYLAASFIQDDHWSMKSLLRRLVTTAAYKQSAKASPQQLETDPYNRLLARGPRQRLSAEQIRDQVLYQAGLLDTRLHGPSVMPVQPAGVWQMVYSNERWNNTKEDNYRRSLYTYWRRTSPYPGLETFDGFTREVCNVRRITTNTPLQALASLNDPAYLEAAAVVSKTYIPQLVSSSPQKTINAMIRHFLYRTAAPKELETLLQVYEEAQQHYQQDPQALQEMLQAAHPTAYDLSDIPPELQTDAAALAVVANTLFNIAEVLTK